MKKYKLLKDLPRAKAGEVVVITNAHSNTSGIVKINKWNEDELQRPRLAYIHTKNINEWLEEIPEKPKSVWELQKYNREPFYRINEEGIINTGYLCREYMENALNLGILFLTRAEAEKELEKRKAIQKIKKYCWENGIKTEYEFGKNDVVFYLRRGDVVFIGDFQNGNPLGYFSYENAQKILKEFEEELKIILE